MVISGMIRKPINHVYHSTAACARLSLKTLGRKGPLKRRRDAVKMHFACAAYLCCNQNRLEGHKHQLVW